MTSRLAILRTRLADLRRRRQAVRLAIAWSALIVAGIWCLAAAFLADYTLDMSRPQRLISLVLVAVAASQAYRRFARPYLGHHETDLDMALLVERRQRIDSDLVAALQFERPESARWGSPQLKEAVIEYVAEFGNGLDVFEGMSYDQFRRRTGLLALSLTAVVAATALYPAHIAAFLNRLILGSAHYPTNTVLERITINSIVVGPGSRSAPPRIPVGRPLKFEVECSGALPENGEVRLKSITNDLETVVPLTPARDAAQASRRTYTGELPRLLDGVAWQVFLGDSWTDAATIEAVSLPTVVIELTDVPPEYAATGKKSVPTAGSRQISVIEGSRVNVLASCLNKRLRWVRMTIGETDHAFERDETNPRLWRLPEGDSPLSRITEPVSFEIQVEDDDGLRLDPPLAGAIRIQPDRAPRVAAAIVTERVLPGAHPSIVYGATDDYGLAAVRVHRQVLRAGREAAETVETIRTPEPQAPHPNLLRGRYALDLKPLELRKGDELKITLEAIDFRGPAPGASAFCEPIVLQVTDESGVLAGLVDADEKSARQLDVIIQRQLGIGESP